MIFDTTIIIIALLYLHSNIALLLLIMNAIIKYGWTRTFADKLILIFQLILNKNIPYLNNYLFKYDRYYSTIVSLDINRKSN